jgi:large subunit ribosomal protein L30
MSKTFKVTLIKSLIGTTQSQKKTMEAIGLAKIRRSVVMADNAANRGQIMKVQHLVEVEVQR